MKKYIKYNIKITELTWHSIGVLFSRRANMEVNAVTQIRQHLAKVIFFFCADLKEVNFVFNIIHSSTL